MNNPQFPIPVAVKTYIALLTQTSTNNPTQQVIHNTFAGTVALTRTGTGTYNITLQDNRDNYTANKTTILTSTNYEASAVEVGTKRINNTTIQIRTFVSGLLSDGLITDATIQIQVWQ